MVRSSRYTQTCTPAQVSAIFLLAQGRLNISADQVNERSRMLFGAKVDELTKAQASDFIAMLHAYEQRKRQEPE